VSSDARIATGLPAHPKLKKLRKRLGKDACWSLVCLFLWAADDRWDGDLTGLSDEDIELAAEWEGEPAVFVKTLAEVGFLEGSQGTFIIHDWKEHNPYAAARGSRVANARKAAAERWSRRESHGEMQSACDPHAESMHDIQKGSAPNPTQPNPDPTQENPMSEQSSDEEGPSPQRSTEPSQEACRLAALLKSEILRNKADFRVTPKQERNWAVTAQRMIDLDDRKSGEIEKLIRWAQRDEFWRTNILSMDKLRDKFDQLQMKCGSQGGKSPYGGSINGSGKSMEERLAEQYGEQGVTQEQLEEATR
jgi:hypothetical protein